MKKLPPRFAPVLFGGLLSFIMVAIVSSIVLLINHGYDETFFRRWLTGFITAWPVAFPTVLVVAPLVRRVVKHLVRPADE